MTFSGVCTGHCHIHRLKTVFIQTLRALIVIMTPLWQGLGIDGPVPASSKGPKCFGPSLLQRTCSEAMSMRGPGSGGSSPGRGSGPGSESSSSSSSISGMLRPGPNSVLMKIGGHDFDIYVGPNCVTVSVNGASFAFPVKKPTSSYKSLNILGRSRATSGTANTPVAHLGPKPPISLKRHFDHPQHFPYRAADHQVV